MVLVRIILQAKWGKAGEVVERTKPSVDAVAAEFGGNMRILTDLSGPFHRVIEEIEVESLGEWERSRAKVSLIPNFRKPKHKRFSAAQLTLQWRSC